MMRILLLGFGKIAYMPYMRFYLDVLKQRKDIEFDLIYWDRDGKEDADVPDQVSCAYKFEAHLEEQLPFKKKLKYFAKYRSFARKILNRNIYDRIIILHTTPGLTLLDYLLRHYRGKYILDFRDVSYEYIPVYRKLVGSLVEGSIFTYVSSNAFRKFLPDSPKIYTIHNYLEDSLNYAMIRKNYSRERDVLRVCYWGLVRQLDVNKKVIDSLGNDPRFELHYYGRMQQNGRDMEAYAKKKNCTNVFFHGQYMPNDRYAFAQTTDIIHNLYDCGNTTGNAMGNKYYDGIIFGIPQLCTSGSYMGEEVSKQKVGLKVELGDNKLANIIWEYYQGINWNEFDVSCMTSLQRILDEQRYAKELLCSCLN